MVPEEVFQNYRVPFHNGSSFIHGHPPDEEEYNSVSGDDDHYDDSMSAMSGDYKSAFYASIGWKSED